jgi:hypothetical protein
VRLPPIPIPLFHRLGFADGGHVVDEAGFVAAEFDDQGGPEAL